MRISTKSINTVPHKSNIVKMIPVCSTILDERPNIIEDFDCTTGGSYMIDNVDQDANSMFAIKIKRYAMPIGNLMWLFFATMEKFDDQWWGVYQARYKANAEPHKHLLWQSVASLIAKNESLDVPLEIHFELPFSNDKDSMKEMFRDVFTQHDLRGEYVLHVVG